MAIWSKTGAGAGGVGSQTGGFSSADASSFATLKTQADVLAFPERRHLRARLRAIAADLVSSWTASGGPPPAIRSRRGLEEAANDICRRAGTGREHAGWTMVAIVSEFWRGRLSAVGRGERLLILPDCPAAGGVGSRNAAGIPATCGPACDVATVWSAARDGGWTVVAASEAVAAIGGLLTRQYEGVLGVAELGDLQKAFSMIPCFSLPIAAVPIRSATVAAGGGASVGEGQSGCPCGIDVETTLGFLGLAAGGGVPVADYLPTLREAADMFHPRELGPLCRTLGPEGDRLARLASSPPAAPRQTDAGPLDPLDASARLSLDFLGQGGKFLRPFITLAAYDAVVADLGAGGSAPRSTAKAAAVAIEIFHKSSLVHDDIEDDDAMRYGQPTMHRMYGVPSAINAGDYLLGLGYRFIASLGGDASCTQDLLAVLSDAHLRLARGQGAELWWRDAGDKRLTPDDALAIYGLKTSPAFEAALSMGVRLAGCRPSDSERLDFDALRRYALHVGTAFQILNDLKDWEGDAENERRAAGDLLGGRPTVLLAIAIERLPPREAAELLALASCDRKGGDSESIRVAARLYGQADVFSTARRLVASERRKAVSAIGCCRLPRLRDVLEFLLDLAVPSELAAAEPAHGD